MKVANCSLKMAVVSSTQFFWLLGRLLDQHLLKEAWVCDTGDLAGDVFGNEILQEHFDSMMQLVAAIEQARDGRRTYN